MNIISRQSIITVVVAVLTFNNFICQITAIPKNTLNWPIEFRTLPPGYRVQPLKDYLSDVRIAGFYTDRYDSNYWVNGNSLHLQRYQYALSPTLLDAEGCFKHDYVIFDCRQPGCFRQPMQQKGYKTVYALNDGVVLARRK